jgi:signal peptidase II
LEQQKATGKLNIIKHRKHVIPVVLGIFFLNYFFDWITKYIAVTWLKEREAIPLFNNVIVIKYAENSGAFLGLGANWNIYIKYAVFLIIPIIACLTGLLYLMAKETRLHRLITGACIIGGGMGNITDRLFNEFRVTDFLNLGLGTIRTGILNMADISVTFGALLLIIFENINSRWYQHNKPP